MALTLNHLFAVIMLSGAFSLVSAMLFVVMDAVDVAFTEAAVGADINSTNAVNNGSQCMVQKKTKRQIIFPVLVVFVNLNLWDPRYT